MRTKSIRARTIALCAFAMSVLVLSASVSAQAQSNEVVPPSTPSGVTAVAGFKQARVSWQSSTRGTYPISHYEVIEVGTHNVLCRTRATRCTVAIPVGESGIGLLMFNVLAVDTRSNYSLWPKYVTIVHSRSNPARPGSITLRTGTVTILAPNARQLTFEGLIASWSSARQTDLPVEGYRVTLYRNGFVDGGCDVTADIRECGMYPNGIDSTYRACVQAMDTSYTYSAQTCSRTVTIRDGVARTFRAFDDREDDTSSKRSEHCPDGWTDTSVGPLRFCHHPDHGSRGLRDAWEIADQG